MKYNAIRTQFGLFFLKGRYGSNRIVRDWKFLKVFEVVKGCKTEWKLAISLIDKMCQIALPPYNHSLLEILENATLAKPWVFLTKICKITTRTTWVKLYCSLFEVFKRCLWNTLLKLFERTIWVKPYCLLPLRTGGGGRVSLN